MPRPALIFVLLALLAAVSGFGPAADASFTAARILCVAFLVLAVPCVLVSFHRMPLE
jgi:uncharacterized membrane protein YtjA (UPF0391 family)